jgi:hypothetical protein
LRPSHFMGFVAALATGSFKSPGPLVELGSWPPGRAEGRSRWSPERMAATLLPTLSPPVSRAAAAFLLRRAPLKPSHYLHPPRTLRRLLSSSSSSYPATPSLALCPLSTMPSTTAARAVPARRDLLMLGIETSCDDTAAAVVLVLSFSILLSNLPAAEASSFCAELLLSALWL